MTDAERLADLILTDWLLTPVPRFDSAAWKKRTTARQLLAELVALEEAA